MEMNINELNAKVLEHTAEAVSVMAKRNDLQSRIERTKADLAERESAVSKSEVSLRLAIIQGEDAESLAREGLAKARREFAETQERLEVITREFDFLNGRQPWLEHQGKAESFQKRLWQAIRQSEMEKVSGDVLQSLRRIHVASLLGVGNKDVLINSSMAGTLLDFLGANSPNAAELKDLQLQLASEYEVTAVPR